MDRVLKSYLSLTRRAAMLAVLLAPTRLQAGAHPCPPPRVLFVCPAGTVKSALARETLRFRAAELSVPVRVTSRGVHSENHVSPGLAANLKTDGLDPAREPLRALVGGDIADADIIIAFDAAAQAPGLEGARTWDVPSWNSNYSEAKSALSAHVDRLLAELRAKPCAAVPRAPR